MALQRNEASPVLSFTGDNEIGHMAPSCSLAESLDSNELVFETGGSHGWGCQDLESNDESDAAQSGGGSR